MQNTPLHKTLAVLALLLISLAGYGQINVSTEAGYAQQVYYSLENGEAARVPVDNWDLAFQIRGFAAAVRINAAKGLELYAVPGLEIGDWSLVDTAGIDTWTALYDSDQTWDVGAFNQAVDPENELDLGWGVYDFITHNVNGDSLYVIKLADGSYRKLRIDALASGVYSFTHARLDGSDEVSASLAKADFAGKNFGYYAFANDSVLDREPLSTEYDLVFTRYITELAPGLYYGVTGILTNGMDSVKVAEARGVDVHTVTDEGLVYLDNISEIGYDWKSFNNQTFQWILQDSLAYFVQARGETYKLVFTGFGGSTTGNFAFEQSALTTSIDPAGELAFTSVYPNPAGETLYLSYASARGEKALLQILDLAGKQHFRSEIEPSGLHEIALDALALPAGLYLIHLSTPGAHATEKIIIR